MSFHTFQQHLLKSADTVIWAEAEDEREYGKVILADGYVAMLVPKAMLELDLKHYRQSEPLNRYVELFYRTGTYAEKFAEDEAMTNGHKVKAAGFRVAATKQFAWAQQRFLNYFPATSDIFLSSQSRALFVTYEDELRGWVMPILHDRGWELG